MEEYTNVWPVFRWVCLYDPDGTDFDYETKETGMYLERYCKEKYPNDKTKPSHHDYMNRHSLHCTRPKPQQRPANIEYQNRVQFLNFD